LLLAAACVMRHVTNARWILLYSRLAFVVRESAEFCTHAAKKSANSAVVVDTTASARAGCELPAGEAAGGHKLQTYNERAEAPAGGAPVYLQEGGVVHETMPFTPLGW
jgi:hypothetical protein